MKINTLGIVAALGLLAAVPAFAEHHSNTIHKLGSALQYGVRKDATNLSIDTHRALGHKSVEHRRYGHYRRNVVITPHGHVRPVYHHHPYQHGVVSHYHHALPRSR